MNTTEITKQEKFDFLAGYAIHQKIQSGKLSIFNLDDDQAELLDRGLEVVSKYFDPDDFTDTIPDDAWEWVKDQIRQ